MAELIIIATGIIAYFVGNLLAHFAHIFFLFAFSLLVTYALLPSVNALSRFKHLPRGAAILIVYLVMLAVLAGLVALTSVPLAKQADQLTRDYPRYAEQLRNDTIPGVENELKKRNLNFDLQRLADDTTANLKAAGGNAAAKTGDIIGTLFGTISDIIVVIFVSVYFLLSGKTFVREIVTLFPARRRRLLKKLSDEFDVILGGYVRGTLLIAIGMGVLAAIFMAAIGLPYWVIGGVATAVTSLIPVIGPFLGVAVPVMIAAFLNPVLIPFILVFYFILNELAHKILYPRIVGQAVKLHPLIVFFGVLVGVKLGGVAGALLATPILAMTKAVLLSLQKTTGYRVG